MTTLADKSLLSSGDNKPPMLEKYLHDSWKSRMELYMMNRPHGRMILASVEKGLSTKFYALFMLLWNNIGKNMQMKFVLDGMNGNSVSCLVSTHQMNRPPYQSHRTRYRENSQHQQFVSPYQSPQYGSPFQSQQYSTHQSSTPLSITYPSNEYQPSIHHNVYSPSSSIPQLEYAPSVNQQSEFSQPDSGLIIPVFQKGDDLIDAINHMMSFLTAVVTSRYPTTNNQLRNSLNLRQQATNNDGRVQVRINSGKQRIVTCYNYKGEGHMYKQSTKPRRKRDDSWFKDKVLLVQAQASGQILHEEELAFLANPGILEGQATQSYALYGEFILHYGSDALAEVYNHDNVDNNMINQVKKEDQIDRYYCFYREINPHKLFTMLMEKPQFFYDHTTKQALGFQNPFYLKKAQQLEPKLYVGDIIEKTNPIVIPDSEETLLLAEESRSKMLLRQKDPIMLEKKVNTTPVDYAALNQLYKDFETCFVPQTELSAEQAFWSQNSVNSPEPILLVGPT
ncbi:hypothetical protein Tco_1148491 [Tanacetum coccineum]